MPTIVNKPWSPEAQKARRHELAALTRRLLRPLLDDSGQSNRLVWWAQSRVALWATHAFFLGEAEDVAFANTIMRYVRDVVREAPGCNCFHPAALAGIIAHHADRLDSDTREFALTGLDAFLPFGMTRDYQFHGYNDNMPIMWTWAFTVGGETLGNPRYTEMAWANLCQLKDLLRRRGAVSEYGANYSTCRVTGIASIATSSQSPAFRALALDLEARIWAELAGHWHPAMGQLCGGSMRGGTPWQHEPSALFRQIFGDEIILPARPWTDHYEKMPSNFVVELGLDPGEYKMAYMYGYGVEFAGPDYHVPDEVAELFYRKPKGFTFRCTAENGYVNGGVYRKQALVYGTGGVVSHGRFTDQIIDIPHFPVHAAQPHWLTTYHGTNYAIGTSTTNTFGSSHAFRCTYRRTAQAATPADYGDVLVRYNTNDKVPCGRTPNTYWKSPEYREESDNYCMLYTDMGRHHCLQEANTVLCLQVPLWLEYWMVRSLRTDLFFHTKYGPVGRLFVGERAVDAFPFASQTEELITVDEGATYMAIQPLIGRKGERQAAVRIWQSAEFLVISLYNYEGAPMELSAREMAKLGNGFVFEVRDADEYPSFAAFKQEMRRARFHDQLYAGVRRVHYARPDLRLSTHVCPYTNTVMHRSVNGLDHDVPQFSYSTGTHAGLPFLDGTPAVGFDDWDWITAQITREAETYNPQD